MPTKPSSLDKQLEIQEGKILFPYDDATGKVLKKGDTIVGNITIGVGHNLSANGISNAVCQQILNEDKSIAYDAVMHHLPWATKLSSARLGVLVNMTFNMGIEGLLTFTNMLKYCENGQYDLAAEEMLNSKWASQVKTRATALAEQMRTDTWIFKG